MHNVLARTAWPSSSYHCASTKEVCQTLGSPFQRHQRILQGPDDAEETTMYRLNNCSEKERLRSREVNKVQHQHIIPTPPPRVRLTALPSNYLQSRPVHVLWELSTPSVGDSEHFIGIHLYKRRDWSCYGECNARHLPNTMNYWKAKLDPMHMPRTQPFNHTHTHRHRHEQTKC